MNWHQTHLDASKFGEHLADSIAGFLGSWKFLIVQSIIFVIWVLINSLTFFGAILFDPYPFILFNLFMSAEAAYSMPLIMMSQNRQSQRDRHQAEMDFRTTQEAKLEIEALQRDIARIEIEKLHEHTVKLDTIMAKLDQKGCACQAPRPPKAPRKS